MGRAALRVTRAPCQGTGKVAQVGVTLGSPSGAQSQLRVGRAVTHLTIRMLGTRDAEALFQLRRRRREFTDRRRICRHAFSTMPQTRPASTARVRIGRDLAPCERQCHRVRWRCRRARPLLVEVPPAQRAGIERSSSCSCSRTSRQRGQYQAALRVHAQGDRGARGQRRAQQFMRRRAAILAAGRDPFIGRKPVLACPQ